MDVREQVAQQKAELEAAVAKALDMASVSADAAEVAITKSTGLSVSTACARLKM
ncbi:TldE protein [Vibrio variabilis]|uniref:TldE protein n=1 Tax=Vibrio variabilis TaxID=990271 RepID=A0ABQ0JFC3_9VIBR|nr:TldE protein [Vibrio variabilis]